MGLGGRFLEPLSPRPRLARSLTRGSGMSLLKGSPSLLTQWLAL